MAKNPYLKFYIGDYIKDTRILPLNARGAWSDLILHMWNNEPKGEICGTMTELAGLMSCPLQEAIFCINLLKEKNIFSHEEIGEGKIRIISRKQKEMLQDSEIKVKAGELGGNPKLSKNYNRPGYVYAMQRPSDGMVKIGISTNPEKRIYKIRSQYQELNIFVIGTLFVDDMGAQETFFHEKFASRKKGEWFKLDATELEELKILLKIKNNSPYGENKYNLKENHEYEYAYILKQLESLCGPIEKKKTEDFMFLVVEMSKTFMEANPEYFFEKEADYSACLQIAYKIAAMKKWMKADVVDKKMKECLSSWKKIVEFIRNDEWLRTRSLSDLSTVKEWQRLVQKMTSEQQGGTPEKKMVL